MAGEVAQHRRPGGEPVRLAGAPGDVHNAVPERAQSVTFSIGDNTNVPTGVPSLVNSSSALTGFLVLLPGSTIGGPIRINWTAVGW